MIAPFTYSRRQIFFFVSSTVEIKQAVIFMTLRPLCSSGLETHLTSVSLSMALILMAAHPEVLPELNCLFVLWEHSCSKQTTAEQELLPLEQSLHLEAKMGQSHTRPTEVAPIGAKPPSPRTLCALRLAEPSQRYCCHYQHFAYPERPMSYSPPYSPSLFKRPDRR